VVGDAAGAQRAASVEDVRARARVRLVAADKGPIFRALVKQRLVRGLHGEQRRALSLVRAGERYIALCCGRRAGKTRFLATLIALLLIDAEFGQEVVFVAPTLKRGKELIWGELSRLVELYCLGYRQRDHQGTMLTDRGGAFRIVGLDNKRQIGKIARGGNTRAFLADEVQEFPHLLQPLVDSASPALGQTRGIFIASGTPGYVRRGYWHQICHGGDGFLQVSWTLFQNPHLGRDASEIVEEEVAKKAWPRNHPTLLREYYAQWVDDASRRVFELSAHNIIDVVPEYDAATWRHFIGVDYGNSPDPCAWVVLAAHPHRNYVAVIHAEKAHRLTSDAICERTNALRVQYAAKRIVGDSASGGKTFIQDFNERYARRAGFSMLPADKANKRDSIDTLNTELRTGRLVLLREAAMGLVVEMEALQWDEDRSEFLPGEDHLADATRYSLRALRAFITKAPAALAPTEQEQELARIMARNRRAQEQQRVESW
jgi:hypothetical protein